MTTSTSNLSVILIGIEYEFIPKDKLEPAKQSLDRNAQMMKDEGIYYELFTVHPEDLKLEKVKAKLEERFWDGVCIGFGIRSQGQVTPMFEALVAKVFQVSPKSKLLFNTLPDNTLDAVKRQFPDRVS